MMIRLPSLGKADCRVGAGGRPGVFAAAEDDGVLSTGMSSDYDKSTDTRCRDRVRAWPSRSGSDPGDARQG